ncbi:allantoinase AllB [Nakamurella flava]|uniref:allantoinase n=1 Tax=Nakamurella flava TaxID=2576308 RepID=A0A4U6QKJ4_9ACTN|nr:allantoinase AllB [Nakamurella flava]TKV60628.1 allantoinase AllB [Nakamurella flava]
MITADLVFRAQRALVSPEDSGRPVERPATVAVRDGAVVAIFDLDAPVTLAAGGREIVLADDEVLLPGLVDSHVHVNEPGRTEWEGFASATRAAAAGGVTTIVDMPLNSIPPTVTTQALAIKQAVAAEKAVVDVGFWGGAVPEHLDDLPALHAAGVFGFKCFLLHSGVDEFPALDLAGLEKAMRIVAELDALLIVHAEDADVIDHAPAADGPTYARFLGSRPSGAENLAIAHVLELARRTGARVHILHLSSADAIPMIAAARRDGVRATVETCPHYLIFRAEEIADGATQFKCCPPIRGTDNQDLLWQALADGIIDCVVSDHSPCTPELKRFDSGDFGAAWGGIASLQLGLPAVWTAARDRGHELAEVVEWMARRPADLVGLPTKGRLAVGAAGDLAVFAPDETFVVDPGRLNHRNPVTPYAGRTLSGVVRSTWLAGRRVDTAADAPAGGSLLRRSGSEATAAGADLVGAGRP